jgi:hypothetical protein
MIGFFHALPASITLVLNSFVMRPIIGQSGLATRLSSSIASDAKKASIEGMESHPGESAQI